MLPNWINPTIAEVRAEADVMPCLVFAEVDPNFSDEERIERLIGGHIETQAAFVWGEARSATGAGLYFPPSLSQLETAYPFESLDELATAESALAELAEWVADHEQRIEQIKNSTRLIVKELVISKLMYGATHDEDTKAGALTHYINGKEGLKSLKKQLVKIKRALVAQTTEPLF